MDCYFFDQWNRKLDKISDEVRVMDQHVTRLEHNARQPRLAMEADGPANTKNRERTEGAATAVQAMHGDSCSTDRVDPEPRRVLPAPVILHRTSSTLLFRGGCSDRQPRCGAQIVSPILGDALTNSRWWLSSHR